MSAAPPWTLAAARCRRGRQRVRVLARVILALAASLAAACDAAAPPMPANSARVIAPDWPITGGGPTLRGVAAANVQQRPTPAWTFALEGPTVSSPVIAQGRVFVGAATGKLQAIALEDGTACWSYTTDAAIEAPPLVLDGRVFVGSTDAWFYAFAADDGRLLWKRETGAKIVGGANWFVAADGQARVVVGSHDHRLYCFAAADGAPLWTYLSGNYVNATPAVQGEHVVFGGCDAVVHAVCARTGTALARVDLGAGCHVAAAVALDGTRVFLGHYGNRFVCVDLAAGKVAWSYPSDGQPFFAPPAIASGRVVFGGRDRRLHCARAGDGAPLWTFPTGKSIEGAPVFCGEHIVFGASDGRLYCVSLAGRLLWEYEIGPALSASPAVAGATIVVAAADGRVHALRVAP